MRSIVMRRDVGNDAASNVVPLVVWHDLLMLTTLFLNSHNTETRHAFSEVTGTLRSDNNRTKRTHPHSIFFAHSGRCSMFKFHVVVFNFACSVPAFKNSAPRHCKMLRPTNKASLRGMPEADSVGIPFRISRRY